MSRIPSSLHAVLDALQVPDLPGLLLPGAHEARGGPAPLQTLLFAASPTPSR